MKKLGLRREHLTELSAEEMRGFIGLGIPVNDGTVSDGSCVCTDGGGRTNGLLLGCDVSAGSCVCGGYTCMCWGTAGAND